MTHRHSLHSHDGVEYSGIDGDHRNEDTGKTECGKVVHKLHTHKHNHTHQQEQNGPVDTHVVVQHLRVPPNLTKQ